MPNQEPTRLHDFTPSPVAAPRPVPARPEEMVGWVLKDAYRLEEKVDEGGMGIVFRATQIALGRPVAVKVMHLTGLSDTRVDRFFREARLLSRLQHPNIVQIIDFGSEPGPLHYMVMEYLIGDSLEAHVRARGRLAPAEVLEVMEQICAAVTVAHENQVIHRDLKPNNVFVVNVPGSPRPVVKVLDFGLGKELTADGEPPVDGITREGVMMGTLGYSAPEQMHGGTVDHRADLYSLGAILYFLLTGQPPYRDEGLRIILLKQLTHPPEPIHLPDVDPQVVKGLEEIVHRAMRPEPADRYASAAELFFDLRRVIRKGETVPDRASSPSWLIEPKPSATTPAPAPSALPHPTRRRWLAAAGAGLVLGLGGGGAWQARQRRSVRPAATAPGVTGDEVLFGLTGPFSGPTRELGREMEIGIRTLFRQVNDQGGVHGRKLRLVALDDGYEPDRAVENVHKLLDEHEVFGFIGNVGTPTTEVTLPLILERKRVLFAPYTGAPFIRKNPPARYVFNYRASYAEETAALVRYLTTVRKVPPRAIAVFAQNDAYGEAGFTGVAQSLRRLGADADGLVRVGYERNSLQVETAVEQLVKARDRVRAVVMVSTYAPAARFIRLVRDAGLDVTFANVSFVGGKDLASYLQAFGPHYSSGVIITQVVPPYRSAATGVLRYREHLARYYPQESPGFISLEGYIAARILVEGLHSAGPTLTAETLVDGLEAIHGLDLAIGSTVTFGPSDHQASTRVWGTVLTDKGEFRDLDLE
ncbi:MAG: ABC transporter substrate-binding protein [Gemmataceae bacterium]